MRDGDDTRPNLGGLHEEDTTDQFDSFIRVFNVANQCYPSVLSVFGQFKPPLFTSKKKTPVWNFELSHR